MASHGREVLGDHHGKDHLTHEETESLGLKVVSEEGEETPAREMQGRIFRMQDQDDASGYLVRETEITGSPATLSYLERA